MPDSSNDKTPGHLTDDPEALALLKLLEFGAHDLAAGKVRPVAQVVARLRAKYPSEGLDPRNATSKPTKPEIAV
jgi:hypothetical protein